MKLRVFTAIGIVLAAMVVVSTGSARWTIGNGTTDLEVNSPNPSLPGQVCTTHIEGRAGLSTTTDPAVTPPTVPNNLTLTVELFTGPAGSLDGYSGGGTGQLLPPDPVNQPIVPVTATVTTAAVTALQPPERYEDFIGNPIWEYAAAPFSFDLAPGVIADGNQVALRVGLHAAILTLSAVSSACTSTQPVTATIDILPGVSSNPVVPSLKLPVLPVRVFGSATLDVTAIATVKLGNAAPATLPPALSGLLAPRDRNGDGFLDRDYVFIPAATGIVCGATSASLTGTLTNGTAFSGTDRVRTILC